MKKYLLVSSIIIFAIFYQIANSYTLKFGYTPKQLLGTLIKTNSESKMLLSRYKKPTILVLGVDPRNDLLEKTEVSDTIMLVQLNLEKNTISIVSLPRDTWYQKYKIKINKLYPLSKKEANPNSFLKKEFASITGQNIDHVLVLTTDMFLNMSKAIGPVEIELSYSFVDDRYPNPEYIKNPVSSVPVYKTISFSKGKNIIDSSNVLEFVRSRKGSDNPALGGTDLGRISRQQILISAYIDNIKHLRSLQTFSQLFKLYKNIETDLLDEDLLLYAQSLNSFSSLSINKINLPINTKDDLIYDPGAMVEGQSVLLPRENFELLKKYLKQHLP